MRRTAVGAPPAWVADTGRAYDPAFYFLPRGHTVLNTLISYGVRCAPIFALTAALVGCGGGSDNIGGGINPPVAPP